MIENPPIPFGIWQRILLFLRANSTGQIVLDVHQGKVCAVSLNERIKGDTPIPASKPR